MKKIMLAVAILFTVSTSFAQLVDVLSAKDAGLKATPKTYSTFTTDDDEIYSAYLDETKESIKADEQHRTYTITKYNPDMTTVFEHKFLIMHFLKAFQLIKIEEVEGTYVVKDKILFFTSLYDGKNKNLYLNVLDKNTGKLLVDKKIVSTLESDWFGTKGRTFDISFSPDDKKMMIISAFQWTEKPQVVRADIYDVASLTITKTIKLVDSKDGQLMNSSAYGVTNDGNVFYFILPNIKISAKKEKRNPRYEILVVHNTATNTDKFAPLPIEFKYLENYDKVQTDKGKITYYGSFKDAFPKDAKRANKIGAYSIAIDLNKASIISSNFNYYSDAIYKQLDYKIGTIKTPDDWDFVSEGLFETTDGGHFLVESSHYIIVTTSSSSSSSMTHTSVRYIAREYVVTKFDASGKIVFSKLIPKFGSASGSKEDMSEGDIVVNGNNLYLFYVEHPKNLEQPIEAYQNGKKYKAIRNITGGVAVCVKIDGSGNTTRQSMFRNEKDKWCYIPGTGTIIPKTKQMTVMVIKGKTYSLQVLRIKA